MAGQKEVCWGEEFLLSSSEKLHTHLFWFLRSLGGIFSVHLSMGKWWLCPGDIPACFTHDLGIFANPSTRRDDTVGNSYS